MTLQLRTHCGSAFLSIVCVTYKSLYAAVDRTLNIEHSDLTVTCSGYANFNRADSQTIISDLPVVTMLVADAFFPAAFPPLRQLCCY